MKTYGGVDVRTPLFLTSPLVRGEWAALSPGRFVSGVGESLRYPLDRRVGWPLSRSGRRGEEKILDLTGTGTRDPFVAIATALCSM
jgi:hypothetical protein